MGRFTGPGNRGNLAMVAVAQLVEPRFVVPVVVGSNPISHPIITNGPLAQPVEQGTLNPKVIGSIPIRPIIKNRRRGLSLLCRGKPRANFARPQKINQCLRDRKSIQ